MEQYYTIQGEGFNAGMSAYFIRIGGCDVGCVWCDVKESWDAEKFSLLEVEKIVNTAAQYSSKTVVITGGEPMMYDLNYLCKLLRKKNIKTFLETSGAYPLSGKWHWICVSPKKFKPPLNEVLQKANELKVIIFNKHDFDWAEQQAKKVNTNCKLFLQPEWEQSNKMLPLIIDYVKKNPQWKISLQTHKFMNIP